MPGRGGGAGAGRRARPRRFRRVAPEEVRAAALAVVRATRGPLASQRALWQLVRARLRREEPRAGLTPTRLRRLLLATPGVRVDIEFAEIDATGPLAACPVCGGALAPIRNRTLDGGPTDLGQRCPACGYWTHRRRRRPVRYTFRSSGTDARPAPRAAAPRGPRAPADAR